MNKTLTYKYFNFVILFIELNNVAFINIWMVFLLCYCDLVNGWIKNKITFYLNKNKWLLLLDSYELKMAFSFCYCSWDLKNKLIELTKYKSFYFIEYLYHFQMFDIKLYDHNRINEWYFIFKDAGISFFWGKQINWLELTVN